MLARSKLNSIESTTSKALIDNEMSYEDFRPVINEERNYRKLKESIRMMKSQRSNIERNKLIENDKGICIDEFIKKPERVNKYLKSQI